MKKYRFVFLISLLFSCLCLVSCSDDSFDHSVAPSSSSDSGSSGDAPELKFGTTYSYYLSDDTDQVWAKISGRKGAVLPSVASPKKAGFRFTGWKTKKGAEPLPTFGSSDLSFYAQWEESSATKLIGSKDAPDTVGDVIFTDGSASPYPTNYSDLTNDQWKAAVAMLFTISYNPTTGSNAKGGQYQYKIAAGLMAKSGMQWCVPWMYQMTYEDIEASEPDGYIFEGYFFKQKNRHFIYNMMYTGYKWDESLDATDNVAGALSLSPYFGLENYASTPQFKMLATADIAPAFDFAIRYGTSQKADESCRDNWYLPSTGELKVLFTNNEIFEKYNRLVIKKFMVAGSPSGFLSRIKPEHIFWTSSSDGSLEYNSEITCVEARCYSRPTNANETKSPLEKLLDKYGDTFEYSDSPPTHDVVVGFWGFANQPSGQPKERIKVFDPCDGNTKNVMLYAVAKLLGEDHFVYYRRDISPLREDNPSNKGGWVYHYVMYNKAYLVDANGNVSFDKKDASGNDNVDYSVIPMRAFN